MRLFISSLSKSTGGQTPISIPDISDFSYPTLGTTTETYWFQPYVSADFPMITGLTKKYFFLWSSDHSSSGSYWGDGDSLDLSDFQQRGYINFEGNSDETPRLYLIGSKLYLFYHPVDQPQQTRLYTSNGCIDFTDIRNNPDWIYENSFVGAGYAPDKPLGLHTLANGNQIGGFDEAHTGYFSLRQLSDNTYEGRHMVIGGVESTYITRYSYSPDGLNWTRGEDIQKYFDVFGTDDQQTGFMNLQTVITVNGVNFAFSKSTKTSDDNDRKMMLTMVDDDWRNPSFLKFLSYSDDATFATFYYEDSTKILHIYTPIDTSSIFRYATLDMSNAENWILEPDYTIPTP